MLTIGSISVTRKHVSIDFDICTMNCSLEIKTSLLNDTVLCNNLLTPWCRVLLEKLTGLQLVKKFPAFHGT